MAADDTATEILPAAPKPTGDAPELIGRTLGKYTLVERLGSGGSGEVLLASEPQLGRTVVVKVLRREAAASPNRIERFLREAKLASRLDHPYAAHVYAFGAEPDGVLWIAMEHVRGMTLDELVARRGAMPPPVFGALFARLCEVVHSAHELGIVHRDIKGTNVMVIERAGQLLPKLLDFGIAKGAEGAVSPGADGDGLTGHGTTLGSPHYMSPEQWERPADVDARADIYALGVLAYRCVAGWLPFHALERAKLGEAHLRQPAPPLPEHVPAPLATAISRALAKQPSDRWPTAIAFAEAVQRACGLAAAPEPVPIFDPTTRDTWLRTGPQPLADALARLAAAVTTVEADAALRELVAIACRWLAVIALSAVDIVEPPVREHARAVIGRDDAAPWLRLARAVVAASRREALPGLVRALAGADALERLATQLDDRDGPVSKPTRTAVALAADVVAAADALRALEPLLAYELVVGRGDGTADRWQGTRRRDRERRVVYEPIANNEVVLLDAERRIVARLSPLAQVLAPLPSAEPELFLLWRGGRGPARLVAAPWGFERDDDAVGSRLAALSTEDSETAADPEADRSPYPGLAAYGTDDADHFVGREREVEALANRLVRAPLIAVLGPSGVGKSSFLHAGVIPRLGEQHRVLTMRPGRHPLHALAALPAVSGETEPAALAARLRELGDSAQRGLVLVVDQLEELVTLCASESERHQFAETLAAAADGPGAPVRVVATLRDDFATLIEAEAALRGRFEVFVLATPPPEALRRIVVEPARRMGVAVEAQVVDDMVAEVAGRPASLPLLSFTGALLWQSRDRTARTITHASYVELGGVAGALAAYADEVYASLARRDQDTVRDLFARLVAADGTRIPAPRAELEQLPGAKAVLAHLIDARLVVVRDEDDRDVIEIVHECLAERWPRLARWRSEDAADRALLGDVRAAARRWEDAQRRADLLWRGEALAELRRLAARSTALTTTERGFADAADRAELRARRIRRGVVVAAMLALAAVAGVMAYLGIAANRSRGEAERSAVAANASTQLAEQRLTQSLVAQGRRELNDGRALPALAYFAEAMRRGADTVGLREMEAIAARAWRYERLVIRPGTFSGLAATPTAIIAGDQAGAIRWWSPAGKPLGELAPTAVGIGLVMTFKRHGDRAVATGQFGVAVIDLEHRTELARVRTATPASLADLGPGADELTAVEHDGVKVYGLDGTLRRTAPLDDTEEGWPPVFDPRGVYVMIASQGKIAIIDRVHMTRRELDEGRDAYPVSSEDGSTIAFIDKDRNIRIVAGDGSLVRTIVTHRQPLGIVLSRTGDRIAAYAERSAVVFDAAGKMIHDFPLDGEQTLYAVRDDDLWMGSNEGVVRRYHDGLLVASLPIHGGQIVELALAGDALATIGGDSSLVVVDAMAHQLDQLPSPCTTPEPQSGGLGMTLVCPDGRELAYIGNHLIGEIKRIGIGHSALEPTTLRGAVSGDRLVVFDRDAKPIATLAKGAVAPGGAVAFADPDHLLVVEPLAGHGLFEWDIVANKLEHIADDVDATAIAVAKGGWVVSHADGHITLYRDKQPVHRSELGTRIDFLTASTDGSWVTAQLANGGTTILDGATGDPVRTLATADSIGTASVLDPTGELVIRPSRATLTLWERATGDELVWSFDLLKQAVTARMTADGRIEVGGYALGTIDTPRDNRPSAQIIHDIECRVPFVVTGGRLEPAIPATSGHAGCP